MASQPAAMAQEAPTDAPSPGQIVATAEPSEWVAIPAEDLLVMTLAPDREGNPRKVVIQLMPAPFSQGWVQNIRTLARAEWYDGISVNRVQDNYVVQWGDPNYDNPEAEGAAKPLPDGLNVMEEDDYSQPSLKVLQKILGEISEDEISTVAEGAYNDSGEAVNSELVQMLLTDPYAVRTSFFEGFSFAFDSTDLSADIWPVHCYGMVGVGRNYSPDTGSGAELYTVIGHAPRHLDRNIALVGRIIEGMEHLSSLPRGKGELGFYTEDEAHKRTLILSVRVASDLEDSEQPAFEYLSTETETFTKYAEARANRRDPFFIYPAGGADICNIPVPIRRVADDD